MITIFKKQRSISDELVARDTFFHSCWNLLKAKRPEFRNDMDKIEAYVSGYDKVDYELDPETNKDKGDATNADSSYIL